MTELIRRTGDDLPALRTPRRFNQLSVPERLHLLQAITETVTERKRQLRLYPSTKIRLVTEYLFVINLLPSGLLLLIALGLVLYIMGLAEGASLLQQFDDKPHISVLIFIIAALATTAISLWYASVRKLARAEAARFNELERLLRRRQRELAYEQLG
jgi:hypothetical protein